MNDTAATSKPIRSPSYPALSLREAVDAVGKIERVYRTSVVDRENAAKLMGYSSQSGPANKALAALASYGLLARAGKGDARVTDLATAILHANNDAERREKLLQAAFAPALFRDLKKHFHQVPVPPESGVITYLNRMGFNQSAIKSAASAFLQTAQYAEELRASKSHGHPSPERPDSAMSNGRSPSTFGGAKLGDLVQWESQGVLRLATPLRVRAVSEDGEWIFVDGSETGIPMDEVLVETPAQDPHAGTHRTPPVLPLDFGSVSSANSTEKGEVEWMRNRVDLDTHVRILVKGDLGPKAIGKLIRLLEAQKLVLEED